MASESLTGESGIPQSFTHLLGTRCNTADALQLSADAREYVAIDFQAVGARHGVWQRVAGTGLAVSVQTDHSNLGATISVRCP